MNEWKKLEEKIKEWNWWMKETWTENKGMKWMNKRNLNWK